MRRLAPVLLLCACAGAPAPPPETAPTPTPDVTAIEARVGAAREAGDAAAEMAALAELIDARPDDSEARLRLGTLQVDAKLFAAAIEHLQRAIELRGSDRGASMSLAHALQNIGRFDEAIAVLEGLKARREAPDPGVRLGWLRMIRGDLDGAEREFAEALEGWPMSAGARVGLGTLQHRSGRHAEARATLEEAISLHVKDPQVHYQLALACRALGDQAAAEAAMARFEELNSGPAGGR